MVFAQIQMDQAKFIQDYWIAHWNANKENQPDPEVTRELTPHARKLTH